MRNFANYGLRFVNKPMCGWYSVDDWNEEMYVDAQCNIKARTHTHKYCCSVNETQVNRIYTSSENISNLKSVGAHIVWHQNVSKTNVTDNSKNFSISNKSFKSVLDRISHRQTRTHSNICDFIDAHKCIWLYSDCYSDLP